MKLLHKLMLNLLLVAIPVAIGGVWLFYTLIHAGIQYEIDEQLTSDLESVRYELQHPRPDTLRMVSSHIEITNASREIPAAYKDTVGLDRREKQLVTVRQLTASVLGKRGVIHRVVIRQPMGEFEEIAGILSVGVTVTFVVLMGVLMLLNGWLIRRIWQPFYQLIEQLYHYRLDVRSGNKPPALMVVDSSTDEFIQLSTALNTMSRNLQEQFVALRQFTDNAAHEMQTPLAVLGNDLNHLLSTEPLTTEQVVCIERAQDSIRRMVRLNKTLLLLTRVENQQFSSEDVQISQLVGELAGVYQDFAHHRAMQWECRLSPDVHQFMNPYLAEVLFSNLMQNAVRYGESGTAVEITLTRAYFQIQNVGPALSFPAQQLFDRFIKNPAHPESTGLGLALVQQIAHLYHFTVEYTYKKQDRFHLFRLYFSPQTTSPGPQVG
ncbi:sensor histidine kinase [Larkinella insperata]|uniref:histidine kinase n=1 Tax=Larkinella insperata TaxID=332158 RepID=A0ABW3QGR8_9BACT